MSDNLYAKGLPTREQLVEAGYPYGKAAKGMPLGDPLYEYARTQPDVIMYKPHRADLADGDNVHVSVFPAPSGKRLLATWTQSTVECHGNNHLCFARSENGMEWSEPRVLAGGCDSREEPPASWGFPIVTPKGRIYVFYAHESGLTRLMGCMYSDDDGETFTAPELIDVPACADADYTDWVIWQRPIRWTDGSYLAGCTLTIWQNPEHWEHSNTVANILSFENLDEHPEPKDIRISFRVRSSVRVADPVIEGFSVCQEPSLAHLPDGRLWMQMRTVTGSPHWAVSADDGHTFTEPEPLRFEDGTPLLHPLSPCPIYQTGEGEYFLLAHCNNGSRLDLGMDNSSWDYLPYIANFVRNPIFLCTMCYKADAHQPLHIDAPIRLLDTGDVAVGPKHTAETGTYTSYVEWMGRKMLYYPDRKFYLLGKQLNQYLN